MFNRLLFKPLPQFPKFAKLSTKLALGLSLLVFLLDYQPSLSIPPVKKSAVKAQETQIQTIESKSLPFSFQLPHPGYISTRFSSFHPGLDIAIGLGMPIKPVAQGVVVNTGFNFWGLGLNVTVDHGSGYKSLYAHLGKIYVSKGQNVETNDILGEVGITGHTSGPHTHLELSKEEVNFDPQTVLPNLDSLPKPEYVTSNEQNSSSNNSSKTANSMNVGSSPSPAQIVKQATGLIQPLSTQTQNSKESKLPINFNL